MKAGPVEIGTLLQNRNRFVVPIYQRHYVWSKNKQWIPFWQDIRTKAVERLADRDRRFSHFMGAIVLESRAKPSVKQVPSFQVVDGQQRLTTFLLFLTAARHYAQKIEHESSAANIRRYILNSDPELMEDPDIEVFKVWPTQANRELFVDIISSEGREELRSKYGEYWYKDMRRDQVHEYSTVPRMLGAYGYFYDRIRQSVETDELQSDLDNVNEIEPIFESGQESKVDDDFAVPKKLKLDAIWQSLLEEFKVVEIVLDEGDDAQVIFETLNDRGEPLLAADLVRNNIFQRADAAREDAEKLFEKHWKPFEAPFWEETDKQGRYRKQRIEFFLANFIAGKIAGDVTISKLFSEYKAFLRPPKGSQNPRYSNIESELIDLKKFGEIYRELVERSSDSQLARFSIKLKPWDVTTANPLILRLWETQDLSLDGKTKALNILLSLIVRRAVCELGSKNYNNLFLSAISSLDKSGWSIENFTTFFLKQTAESGRFPRDEEFEQSFINKPMYSVLRSARTKAVLEEIELAKRQRFQETDTLKNNLSVEHILPQNWIKHWPMMDEVDVDAGDHRLAQFSVLEDDSPIGKIVRRNRISHSIGNLTLVTPSFNSSVKNLSFEIKQKEFNNQSTLMLTKDFSDNIDWNEDEILLRAQKLFGTAIKVWPLPE